MGIDLKKRMKNKAFWAALAAAIVMLVFNILDVCNVKIPITYDEILNIINIFLTILVMFGVVVDTSTPGVADKKENNTDESEG